MLQGETSCRLSHTSSVVSRGISARDETLFQVFTDLRNLDQAKAQCRSEGGSKGRLAAIHNDRVNQILAGTPLPLTGDEHLQILHGRGSNTPASTSIRGTSATTRSSSDCPMPVAPGDTLTETSWTFSGGMIKLEVS